MKKTNIFTKTLKILFFVFLMFIMFTVPAQACRTGVCYENGISGTATAACGGTCPDSPCGRSFGFVTKLEVGDKNVTLRGK